MIKQDRGRIKYIFKGLMISFILTLIMILIFSLFLSFTSLRESKLPLFNNLVMIFSIVIGSIYVATKVKENGWLNGALIGLGYYIILTLLGLLFIKPFILDFITVSRLVIALITGVIGGMIGINLS